MTIRHMLHWTGETIAATRNSWRSGTRAPWAPEEHGEAERASVAAGAVARAPVGLP